jgi:hypothetical protein
MWRGVWCIKSVSFMASGQLLNNKHIVSGDDPTLHARWRGVSLSSFFRLMVILYVNIVKGCYHMLRDTHFHFSLYLADAMFGFKNLNCCHILYHTLTCCQTQIQKNLKRNLFFNFSQIENIYIWLEWDCDTENENVKRN